jgi:hypothetical protein
MKNIPSSVLMSMSPKNSLLCLLIYVSVSRHPAEIKADGGFTSRAQSNRCKDKDTNFSMWDHCKPAVKGFAIKPNDCYVSVSELFFVTIQWLEEKVPNGIERGIIYKIASSPIFISCAGTLSTRKYTHSLRSSIAI